MTLEISASGIESNRPIGAGLLRGIGNIVSRTITEFQGPPVAEPYVIGPMVDTTKSQVELIAQEAALAAHEAEQAAIAVLRTEQAVQRGAQLHQEFLDDLTHHDQHVGAGALGRPTLRSLWRGIQMRRYRDKNYI